MTIYECPRCKQQFPDDEVIWELDDEAPWCPNCQLVRLTKVRSVREPTYNNEVL